MTLLPLLEPGDLHLLERTPREGTLAHVRIESLTPEGHGRAVLRARLVTESDPRAWTFDVHGALPGDVVELEIYRTRRTEMVARCLRIVTRAPGAVAPRCSHAGFRGHDNNGCGGCTLQEWSYDQQRAFKRSRLQTLLQAAGFGHVPVPELLVAPSPWRYRNKMEFSFAGGATEGLRLGLHPAGLRFEVTQLEDCWLMPEGAGAFAQATRQALEPAGWPPYRAARGTGILRTLTVRHAFSTGQWMLELTTAPLDGLEDVEAWLGRWVQAIQALDVPGAATASMHHSIHDAQRGQTTRILTQHLAGPAALHETLYVPGAPPLGFDVHPRAFFQPNPGQAQALYGEVLRACRADRDEGLGEVFDLYCGTGTIGLCLAPFARQVTGIELSKDAVANAETNARANGLTNTRWFAGDAAEVLAGPLAGVQADAVVVDPPRAGLGARAVELVKATGAQRVVYVSCNPESLARDAALLRDGDASWQLVSVQPVDMFPHTSHLETVARFERVGPSSQEF